MRREAGGAAAKSAQGRSRNGASVVPGGTISLGLASGLERRLERHGFGNFLFGICNLQQLYSPVTFQSPLPFSAVSDNVTV